MSTKIIIFAIDPNQIKSRNTKNKSNKMESTAVYGHLKQYDKISLVVFFIVII